MAPLALRAIVALCAFAASLAINPAGGAGAAEQNRTESAGNARVVSLVWNRSPAAASCLGEAALARAVEQRVGRLVFAPPAEASLLIDGVADHDQPRGPWRATLSLSAAGGAALGRRELSSAAPGCGPLGEMVALTIALMIRDREASSTAVATVAVPAPAPPPSLSTNTRPEAQRRAWEATGDLTAGLSVGLLPNPATTARLRGVGRLPRVPAFELEAAVALPGQARFGPEAGGRFLATWLGAAVCPLEWSPPPWRARLCAGASIGVLFFTPFGTDSIGVRRRPLLVGRVSAGLERALGAAWFAVAGAELFIPAFRERFEIHDERGAHTLFEMTPVGVGGALGLGRRF